MHNIHFYSIGIAFTSGVFLRSFFDIDFSGIALIAMVGAAFIIVGKILKPITFPFLVVGILFLVATLGIMRLSVEENKTSPLIEYEGQEVEFSGRVVREPELRKTTAHFYVKPHMSGTEIDESVLVLIDRFEAIKENILYGDIVLVEGTLSRPEAFASNDGRVFDYPGFLKTREVLYTVRYGKLTLAHKGADTFLSKIYKGKAEFQESLENAIPMPHAGLGEGILLGVKRALGDELEEVFRKTGIIHIVVWSGYNVMIVVDTMMLVLAFFFIPRTRMIIGICAIILFALLVGPSATVVRASIMAGLLLIARSTGRTYAILRALMLAGIIMLLVNPYLLVHDPGFQLSFLATLALILFASHVEEKLTIFPSKFGIRRIVTATLVTQIFVLPLLLYQMGLLSFVSVIVNVLILPVVPTAMLMTLITGMAGIFSGSLATFVGFFTYYILEYMIVIPEFFGSLKVASMNVAKFPAWIMFLAYGIMAMGTFHIYRKKNMPETTAPENLYKDWVIEEEKSDNLQQTKTT